MYHSPYWLNLRQLWIGWPDREIDGLFKWYYLVQFAFWLQQILVVNIEERRKDHWQMFAHHIITCTLIFTSYGYHFTRVGNTILCLMDVVDIIFPVRPRFLRFLFLFQPFETDTLFPSLQKCSSISNFSSSATSPLVHSWSPGSLPAIFCTLWSAGLSTSTVPKKSSTAAITGLTMTYTDLLSLPIDLDIFYNLLPTLEVWSAGLGVSWGLSWVRCWRCRSS